MKHPVSSELLTLALGTTTTCAAALPFGRNATTILIPSTASADANRPLSQFLFYSIELSSFPDFAGNLSNPNAYSNNLLSNLAVYSGSKPLIRVGGNTQD